MTTQQQETIASIRAEYLRETGEKITVARAEYILEMRQDAAQHQEGSVFGWEANSTWD